LRLASQVHLLLLWHLQGRVFGCSPWLRRPVYLSIIGCWIYFEFTQYLLSVVWLCIYVYYIYIKLIIYIYRPNSLHLELKSTLLLVQYVLMPICEALLPTCMGMYRLNTCLAGSRGCGWWPAFCWSNTNWWNPRVRWPNPQDFLFLWGFEVCELRCFSQNQIVHWSMCKKNKFEKLPAATGCRPSRRRRRLGMILVIGGS
jgi:hypothetical protein